MNKRDRMYQEIKRHGENINTIFGMDMEPVTLSKRLHRIEVRAHKLAEDYCNGLIDSDDYDIEKTKTLKALNMLLGYRAKGIQVLINSDPRGYALKIADGYVRAHNLQIHRDMGGYGILAPEFDGEV